MRTTIAALMLVFFACGATTGREIKFEDTSKLVVGTSTRADAEAIFGRPVATSFANGTTYLAWVYAHADFGGSNAGSKTLLLSFGPDGKYIGVATMGASGTETVPAPAQAPGLATALPPAAADGGQGTAAPK